MANHRSKRKLYKRSGALLWLVLCVFALLQTFMGKYESLILIPLPLLAAAGLWLSFYFLVILHEMGHVLVGRIFGFPVNGIEVGLFPYKTFKIKKFTLHIGKVPGSGKTLLGPKVKSFSRAQHLCFLSAGIVFEFLFFVWMFHELSGFFWLRILLALFYADQLWVNLYPQFDNGLAINDGALLLEVLFPKKSLYKAARSYGKSP